ncbi:AAA-type ATPase family protein [Euphorbia peplus]|nr:AAA-type ATPase family protein [Euphorbia peplus]
MAAEASKFSRSLFRDNTTGHLTGDASYYIMKETSKGLKKSRQRSVSSMPAYLEDPSSVDLPSKLSHPLSRDNTTSRGDACSYVIGGLEERSKGVRKIRPRSVSSTPAYLENPSSLDLPSSSADSLYKYSASSKSSAGGRHLDFTQPSIAPSTSRDTLKIPAADQINTSHYSQRHGWSVGWQWSRMRKLIVRGNDESPQKDASKANHSQSQVFSSTEIDPMSLDDIRRSAYSFSYFNRNGSQCIDREQKRHFENEKRSSTISLSHKYQPKSFQDIVGHEINIKVISSAVEKNKVSQLYLFHGPSGTGKTSAAVIFSMALLCESTSQNKPCWSCRGCSRSIYMMELCSGSRTTGFQKISTLLQCTSFAHAVPGYKVFIIEESHSLTTQAWEELLGILENIYNTSLVFVLIAADANMIPESVSSRCQKFCFPRLNRRDVALKLERIIVEEGIRIEEEALKLIVGKAEGSLKEAEHILDQLTLLGPRVASSMVQQLLGLIPKNKLMSLLTSAISGDTKMTIITARELLARGVEAEAIVFQLASVITDMLTGADITSSNPSEIAVPSKNHELLEKSQIANTSSENLCYALKVLLEAEKQPRSSFDHITWLYAALLQIASLNGSDEISSRIYVPKRMSLPFGDTMISHNISMESHHSMEGTCVQQSPEIRGLTTINQAVENTGRCKGNGDEREFNLACLTDMDEIWLNILERIRNRDMKEFLSSHAKLASLTVSSANAIVHLIFKRTQDKMEAQMSEESMSNALEMAIGCSVVLNISSEPVDFGIINEYNASSHKCHLAGCNQPKKQQHKSSLPKFVDNTNPGDSMHQNIFRTSGPSYAQTQLLTGSKDATFISQGNEAIETAMCSKALTVSGTVTEENKLGSSVGSTINSLGKDRILDEATHIMRREEPKHKWLSLSSFQQNDASVEPYSQDILFENEKVVNGNRARKHLKPRKDSSKVLEVHHLQDRGESKGLLRSWSCKELLCQKTKK